LCRGERPYPTNGEWTDKRVAVVGACPSSGGARRRRHRHGLRTPRSAPAGRPGDLLIAFGFRPSRADWFDDHAIEIDGAGRTQAYEDAKFKYQTTHPRIFAGGDMVRGSDLVVTAVW